MHNRSFFFLALLALPLVAQPNLLSVTADAEVVAMPDRVAISVGVETRHPQLAAARAKNESAVRAVLAAAVRNGVAVADVQTDFIEITPVYKQHEDSVPVHYRVHKAMMVTLRDVRRFDGLLTALMDAGANQVYGVEFQSSSLRQHRDKAREMAMKAALEKAQALAGAAGLKVGKATAITSYNVGSSSRYGRWRDPYRNDLASQNVSVQQMAGGSSGGTFAPGRISIRADVALSFPIHP